MSGYKKYCAVCLGDGVDEFRNMIDFATEPGETVGLMKLPTVLIATFVSKLPKKEMMSLFKEVEGVNFFIMEFDNSIVYFENEELLKTLVIPFETPLIPTRKNKGEVMGEEKTEKSDSEHNDVVKKLTELMNSKPWFGDGVSGGGESKPTYDVDSMDVDERKALLDKFLDKYDELDEYELTILRKLSK